MQPIMADAGLRRKLSRDHPGRHTCIRLVLIPGQSLLLSEQVSCTAVQQHMDMEVECVASFSSGMASSTPSQA